MSMIIGTIGCIIIGALAGRRGLSLIDVTLLLLGAFMMYVAGAIGPASAL